VIALICETVRKGHECPFMSSRGCTYNGGICREAVEPCSGCGRLVEYTSAWYCSACPEPAARWRSGNCNLATHVTADSAVAAKAKVNPLKASKRASKRK